MSTKEYGKNDSQNELPKSVLKSILKAEKELREGRGIPHKEVMKKYSLWLTNNVITKNR